MKNLLLQQTTQGDKIMIILYKLTRIFTCTGEKIIFHFKEAFELITFDLFA